MPYCSSQQDIIDAFTNWFDNLIDPTTECYGVRIARVELNDDVGPEVLTSLYRNDLYGSNSFTYNIGRDVITGDNPQGILELPGPCGGAMQYEVIVEADCTEDGSYEGTQGADLLIVVGPSQKIDVPEPETFSTCDNHSTIQSAYSDWVNTFNFEPANLSEFSNWGSTCQNTSGCSETQTYSILVDGVPRQTIILCNSSKTSCLRNELAGLITNQRLNCGTIISVSMTRSIGGGNCPTVTLNGNSSFTLNAPTININHPGNLQFPACSPAADISMAFINWRSEFGYTDPGGSCTYREEFYVNGSAEPVDRASIIFDQFCGDTIEIDYRVINMGCSPGLNLPEQIVAQRTRTFILNELTMANYDPNYMICSTEPVGLDLQISPFIPSQDIKAQFYITGIAANGMTPDDQNSQVALNTPVGKEAIKQDAWLNLTASPLPVTYTIVPVIDCDSTDMDLSVCTGQAVDIVVLVKPLSCPDNIELELMVDKTDTTYHYPQDLFCSNSNIVYDPPSGNQFFHRHPCGEDSVYGPRSGNLFFTDFCARTGY